MLWCLLLSSHAKDKQKAAQSILPFRDAVLAAVWVGFAIIDPSLEGEAIRNLPQGMFEGVQGTPGGKLASPPPDLYTAAPHAAGDMLPAAEDGERSSPGGAERPVNLVSLSMVDLLLEKAAAHALAEEEQGGWLNPGSFHFAFNSELLKLHGALVSMAHGAEVHHGVAFSYIHLLSVNILCLLLFTPFGLAHTGWLNPLFAATVALTYGGLLVITRELSNPFTCEPRHRGINLRATAHALARDWVGGANFTLLAKLVGSNHARRSSMVMLMVPTRGE